MSSNYPKLSEGSIDKMGRNEKVLNPILQIMLYKQIVSQNNKENKYRFVLNDGINCGSNFIVVSNNLIERIQKGEFEKFTAIQLNEYMITTHVVIDKQVILIQDMTAIMPGSQIGHKLEKNASNAGLLSNVKPIVKNEIQSNPSVENISNRSHTNYNCSSVGTSASTQTNRSNVCPIIAITPYFNAWLIKVRVTSKANLRKYNNAKGEGSVFSFDVMDQSGEIRITAFNKECDKFYNMIEVNKVYYISKGMVKTANKRFSNLANDYEITLTQESVIELCDETLESVPKLRFKFVSIKDLENCAQQSIVDVIGIVKSVDDCVSIMSKKTNKELKKRDIILLDMSAYEVRLTLWNETAEQFDCPINSVLAVKHALVGEFNGKTLSAVSNTTTYIDPEVPETNLLRNWFIREGQNITTNALSKTGGDNSKTEWKYLCQLNEQSIGNERTYFNITAKVSTVGKNPLYKACGANGCLKKVRDDSNGFYHCDRCQTDSPTFQWRLILSLNVIDCTSDAWITLFQEQAEKILGITCQELSDLMENSPQDYQKALASSDFKEFVFKIGSRTEQYMDESRVKSVGYNFNRIDPVKHSKKLLQTIKAWSN